MFITFEEEISTEIVDQVLEQYDADAPIVPRRIGFCCEVVDIKHWRGELLLITCNAVIDDQDILAVELPRSGKRRQFCCGPCVERLLAPKAAIDLDLPEKLKKKNTRYKGINGNGGQPKPKQPKFVKAKFVKEYL